MEIQRKEEHSQNFTWTMALLSVEFKNDMRNSIKKVYLQDIWCQFRSCILAQISAYRLSWYLFYVNLGRFDGFWGKQWWGSPCSWLAIAEANALLKQFCYSKGESTIEPKINQRTYSKDTTVHNTRKHIHTNTLLSGTCVCAIHSLPVCFYIWLSFVRLLGPSRSCSCLCLRLSECACVYARYRVYFLFVYIHFSFGMNFERYSCVQGCNCSNMKNGCSSIQNRCTLTYALEPSKIDC